MNQVIQNTWFWLICAYVVLEIFSIVFFRESYVFMMIRKLLELLFHSFTEVTSPEARQRVCGMLISACALCFLTPIVYAVNCAFTDSNAVMTILACLVIAMMLIALTMYFYDLNRRYVVQG